MDFGDGRGAFGPERAGAAGAAADVHGAGAGKFGSALRGAGIGKVHGLPAAGRGVGAVYVGAVRNLGNIWFKIFENFFKMEK